jgi:hypothetical protein
VLVFPKLLPSSGCYLKSEGYTFCGELIWTKLLKVKDKAIPLQVWTGPEGSKRLKPPDFKTIGTRKW